MKKSLKKMLFSACAAMLAFTSFSVVAQDEQSTERQKVNVLCVGNSILAHGASESLGWYGDWGMAASSRDKEYYSVLQSIVKQAYPEIEFEFNKVAVATLERSFDTSLDRDYTPELNSAFSAITKDFIPDIVTLQIGDNVQGQNITTASYQYGLEKVADYFLALNPDVVVIYAKPFFGGSAKNNATFGAAVAKNFPCADLNSLAKNSENTAVGLFEHGGVASHPGDKGMQAIADEFFSQMKPVLDKKLNPASVSVMVDNKYLSLDVPAQIVDGRTLVPLRAIFEALGAKVEWNDATKTVNANRDEVYVSLTIGSNELTKDGEKISLDVPAQIVDSRTLVPVRAISEAYDCDVQWDGEKRLVKITSPDTQAPTVFTELPTQTFDNNKAGFYTSTGNSTLSFVSDPDDPENKVAHIKPVKPTKFWAYIWMGNFKFEAGKKYKFSAKVRPIADGNGIDQGTYNQGFCFHFNGKDKGLGGTKVPGGVWTNVEKEFTMPDDYKYSEADDRIGVYFDPVNEIGVEFMIDDIKIEIVD